MAFRIGSRSSKIVRIDLCKFGSQCFPMCHTFFCRHDSVNLVSVGV